MFRYKNNGIARRLSVILEDLDDLDLDDLDLDDLDLEDLEDLDINLEDEVAEEKGEDIPDKEGSDAIEDEDAPEYIVDFKKYQRDTSDYGIDKAKRIAVWDYLRKRVDGDNIFEKFDNAVEFIKDEKPQWPLPYVVKDGKLPIVNFKKYRQDTFDYGRAKARRIAVWDYLKTRVKGDNVLEKFDNATKFAANKKWPLPYVLDDYDQMYPDRELSKYPQKYYLDIYKKTLENPNQIRKNMTPVGIWRSQFKNYTEAQSIYADRGMFEPSGPNMRGAKITDIDEYYERDLEHLRKWRFPLLDVEVDGQEVDGWTIDEVINALEDPHGMLPINGKNMSYYDFEVMIWEERLAEYYLTGDPAIIHEYLIGATLDALYRDKGKLTFFAYLNGYQDWKGIVSRYLHKYAKTIIKNKNLHTYLEPSTSEEAIFLLTQEKSFLRKLIRMLFPRSDEHEKFRGMAALNILREKSFREIAKIYNLNEKTVRVSFKKVGVWFDVAERELKLRYYYESKPTLLNRKQQEFRGILKELIKEIASTQNMPDVQELSEQELSEQELNRMVNRFEQYIIGRGASKEIQKVSNILGKFGLSGEAARRIVRAKRR